MTIKLKKISELLVGVENEPSFSVEGISINKIEFDSRKVSTGDLFIAIRGTHTDGHQFINKAFESGAIAVVCEEIPSEIMNRKLTIKVKDSGYALGIIASNYYGNPSGKLKLVGVTGTNGKTTTASLLYSLFIKSGHKAGLISTVKYFINDREFEASHTTPDSITLNKFMHDMVDEGCEYCFIEVSSHSVVQSRIAGLSFAGAIFSNITHDHLDYHGTFAEYIKAKKGFFDSLSPEAFALTNIDDKNGTVMLQNTKAKKYTYSVKSFADFKCRVLENHYEGMLINFDGVEVFTHFLGGFNAYNLLAVYASAVLLGQEKSQVLTCLSDLFPVSGRFETIRMNNITAIVDYAHTPDALVNVLQTIMEIKSNDQNLITVVGAGGDRDKTKRPKMASICAEHSDKVILTSDNPRTEKPEDIIEDMFKGIEPYALKKVIKITDRKEAIKTACMLARKGDIILIAGKGHEPYQEVNGVRHHFDDREVVKELLSSVNN